MIVLLEERQILHAVITYCTKRLLRIVQSGCYVLYKVVVTYCTKWLLRIVQSGCFLEKVHAIVRNSVRLVNIFNNNCCKQFINYSGPL